MTKARDELRSNLIEIFSKSKPTGTKLGHFDEVIETILSQVDTYVKGIEDAAFTKMANRIEQIIKDFDGGDSNINGGLNTDMTGHGAMDFVRQAESELQAKKGKT